MQFEQKLEALNRLELLAQRHGLDRHIVNDFEKKGLVYVATTKEEECRRLMSRISRLVERLKRVEGVYPYYLIFDDKFLTVLYVSRNEDDWVKERPSYIPGRVYAFVIDYRNHDSDCRLIGINNYQNVVLRTDSIVGWENCLEA